MQMQIAAYFLNLKKCEIGYIKAKCKKKVSFVRKVSTLNGFEVSEIAENDRICPKIRGRKKLLKFSRKKLFFVFVAGLL